MKVNHSYLISALHIDGITDMSSSQAVASLILDYLYTEAGYRAFLALIASLCKVPSYVISSSKSKDPGPEGVEEDFFATLMRRLTDFRDWQIIDLFDLFDRFGDGLIRTRDLFVLVALLVSADARRSTLVFYLHRKELFEILSRRTVPPEIDGDDSDLYDDSGEESTEDGVKNLSRDMERKSRRKSVSGKDASPENRSRSRSNASLGGDDESQRDDGPSPSSSSSQPLMTFAQFCGVATPVGVPPSRSIAILEKFGVHEGGQFSYSDYLVYGYWVLSHVDAQDDDTAPSAGDDHHQQQQQSQVGGDSQASRFCVVM